MHLSHLIFVCLLTNVKSTMINRRIGQFIGDITKSVFVRSSFKAFFCMNMDDTVAISRQVSSNHVMHEIINGFEDYDFTGISTKISMQSTFVLDLNCPHALEFLLKANANQVFRAPSKWLILQDFRRNGNSTNSRTVISERRVRDFFEELQVYPDSEILIGQQLEDDFINLISLYRPSPYRSVILENRGTWNAIQGISMCDDTPSSRRRQDLFGSLLKSCLVMTDPNTLNHLTDYRDKGIDGVTKASYIWLLYLVNRMNATLNFTVRDTWGYRGKNGTWNGMIGMLDRGEIDIGGTATFLVPQRIGVIDYVQLYIPITTKFVFRRPPLSYVSNLFTLPFQRSVWITIAIFLSLISGFLYLTMKFEWRHYDDDDDDDNDSEISTHSQFNEYMAKPNISENFLIILGAVTQQGFVYFPRTISSRIITFMLLIAAFSLYASYTAYIVAILQSTSTSINTLRDLMDSGMKIGIADIVYNRYYFTQNDDPMRKEFNERMVENKTSVWMPMAEGVHKIRMGLFAFHTDTNACYHVVQQTFEEDEKCGLHEIDYMGVLNPLFVIKHHSPYSEIIKVGALWIREAGLKGRDIPRIFTEKPSCTGYTRFVHVGIAECYAAIYAIVYGIAISIGVLFFEILWNKCSKEKDFEQEPDDVNCDDEISTFERKSIE